MANLGATFRGTATLESGSTPTIYNVSVPTANVEVSQALSPQTKKFSIRVRGLAKLKLSYDSGQSGITYLTISPGAVYTEDMLNFSGTLYFQSNVSGTTVEIVEWV